MKDLDPILLADLGDYEKIAWYWEGFAAPYRKTIFVGHPKAGKTTLMSHLVLGFSGRPANVGPKISPVKTLILTEEHEDLWKRRRDDLNIDGTQIWIQRIKRALTQEDWLNTITQVAVFCALQEIGCIIIDTLSALWPATDENDAIAVGKALDPLNALANSGFSIICIHHAPKAKQSAVISARGSTAITAFFDIVVNMRTAGRGTHTTRRTLKAWGRDLETPESMTLEYKGTEGYDSFIGDEEELVSLNFRDSLTKALPNTEPGIGIEALRTNLKMAYVTLQALISQGIKDDSIARSGSGKRGDPYLYLSTP